MGVTRSYSRILQKQGFKDGKTLRVGKPPKELRYFTFCLLLNPGNASAEPAKSILTVPPVYMYVCMYMMYVYYLN